MTFASYACLPENSQGRLHHEDTTPYRNMFQRDKDRLIHSNAFRRMQYKTQVFINHEGDHYRNRLTHSIEVASIARSIADSLGLSSDLAECIALAHDLGHTPFGHAGEIALNQSMKEYGGFCHNAHALKLLTSLEKKYASYYGLNLCWEVIEGVAKHNGPIGDNATEVILEVDKQYALKLHEYSSAEAQSAALADDIAYLCHDLEDGVRSKLLTIGTIEQMPILQKYIQKTRNDHGNSLTGTVLIYESVRSLMHEMIADLLDNSRSMISSHNIQTEDDIRKLDCAVILFSQEWQEKLESIRAFLFKNLYYHPSIIEISNECQKVIAELFKIYYDTPNLMPGKWQDGCSKQDKAFIISDYIAGMTDRFAIKEFEKHTGNKFNRKIL